MENNKKPQRMNYLVIIVILSFLAVKPLFIPGFFPMHDDTQPSRVYEMAESLRDGMFPVRWVADLGYGYGYPIFNFYGPLSYYIGGMFNLFGFDALVATKIMMGLGFVLAGVSMYLLAREFWGERGGVVSGLLYLYAPYHAVNLYVRGDVGEFWAYGFIPLVFLAVYKLFKVSSWKWIGIGALSYAAVITSHNLTAMMVTPYLIIFELLLPPLKKRRKNVLYALLLGILLSAFYWLPTVGEVKYTNVLSQIGGTADYRQHFVCPLQLWDSPWGFGGSAPGCVDGMSYKIGKLHVVLSVFAFLLLPILLKKYAQNAFIVIIVLLLLAGSVWFTSESSRGVWDVVPLMEYFQYPWRFLLMISFFSSFLGGIIVWFIENISKRYHYRYIGMFVIAIVVTTILLLYGKLFQPQTIVSKTAVDYTSEENLKWKISKISDEYLPKNFRKPINQSEVVKSKITLVSGIAAITDVQEKTQMIRANVTSGNTADIKINSAYFPAWQGYVDGKKIELKILEDGMIVSVPKGRHMLEVRFEQTSLEKFANILSLAGIVVLIVGIMKSRYEETFS